MMITTIDMEVLIPIKQEGKGILKFWKSFICQYLYVSIFLHRNKSSV